MELVAFSFEVFKKIIDPVERLVALPQQLLRILLEKPVGDGQVHTFPLHGEQHLFLPPVRARFAPWLDGALDERLVLVGNDERRVIAQNVAEAFAFRAGAQRMIE